MNSCEVQTLEPAPQLPGVMAMYEAKRPAAPARSGEDPADGRSRQILDLYEGLSAVHRHHVRQMSAAWQAYVRTMSSLLEAADLTRLPFAAAAGEGEAVWIDPKREEWLWDHCPTYTLPAYPFMFMLDKIAQQVQKSYPRQVITVMRDVQVHRWLVCGQRQLIKTELAALAPHRIKATLLYWREAGTAALSRFEPLMTADVEIRDDYQKPRPSALPELEEPQPIEDPYGQDLCFHGPRLRVIKRLFYGANGSRAQLSAAPSAATSAMPGPAPGGILNPRLLDGLLQTIPYDELSLWTDPAMEQFFCYPRQVPWVEFYAPVPRTGEVRCEVRFAGFREENRRFPQFDIAMSAGEQSILALKLVGICFPQGRWGALSRRDRKRFLLKEDYLPGASLGDQGEDGFFLPLDRVKEQDWFPGALEQVYALPGAQTEKKKTTWIAVKEYVAAQLQKHPAEIILEEEGGSLCQAYHPEFPLRRYRLFSQEKGAGILVKGAAEKLDIAKARQYWRERLGLQEWVAEDIFAGLARQFISEYQVEDAAVYQALLEQARPVLYLANHQTTVEAHLFIYLTSALARQPVGIIAKKEHQKSTWIGQLLEKMGQYPGINGSLLHVFYFDRQDQASLLHLLQDIRQKIREQGLSLLVHAEGTRALQCRKPVEKVSSVFIDLALELQLPLVPVRFAGGLPLEPLAQKLEFPYRYGRQSVHLGPPLWPAELAALPYAQRKEKILTALNTTGPPLAAETPSPGDGLFQGKVEKLRQEAALDEARAVILQVLRELDDKSSETLRVLNHAGAGRPGNEDAAKENWLEEFSAWLHG